MSDDFTMYNVHGLYQLGKVPEGKAGHNEDCSNLNPTIFSVQRIV